MSAASYVVTVKLPPSYTIVPLSDWTSFTSAALPAGSLVRIHATSIYYGALGFVIGASTNPVNECALVAVIPKIEYPDIRHPTEDEPHRAPTKQLTKIRFHTDHLNSPPKKCTKIKSPNHPNLFDPKRLLIHDPHNKGSSSSNVHTTVYENGFKRFFETKFPSIDVNGVEHWLNLDNFTYHVCQREVDYTITNESSSYPKLDVFDKTPPVYHYHGHHLGTRIIPIFKHQSLSFNHIYQVHEVLPFMETRLAPDIFDPLISQMHWKRGDKLLDLSQTFGHPFYRIHRVDLQEGVVVAHLVLSYADKEDAEELQSAGFPVDINCLPHEYNLSAFWLRLVVGDHVRVTAGIHKTICGTIIASLSDEGYASILPYGDESDQLVSYFAYFWTLVWSWLRYLFLLVGSRCTLALTSSCLLSTNNPWFSQTVMYLWRITKGVTSAMSFEYDLGRDPMVKNTSGEAAKLLGWQMIVVQLFWSCILF